MSREDLVFADEITRGGHRGMPALWAFSDVQTAFRERELLPHPKLFQENLERPDVAGFLRTQMMQKARRSRSQRAG